MMSEETQFTIAQVCDEIKSMLIAKNKSYGDSALNPVKLSRISRGGSFVGDNDIDDLIGYLILLKIARELNSVN